jgi:hypothetical protein
LYGSLTSVRVLAAAKRAVRAAASAFLAACFAGSASLVTYGVAVILHCVVGVFITKKAEAFPGCARVKGVSEKVIPLASDVPVFAGGHAITVRDLVGDVTDPVGPVQLTDCVYVPGVSINPVETAALFVPPKLPFTIPDPEQAVAFVELYPNVEKFPASIVEGENALSVTVIG